MHLQQTAADYGRPVPREVLLDVQQFYFMEARLLDGEHYRDWLEMLSEDVRYWMPGVETRKRGDRRGSHSYGEMAYFEDDIASLRVRVARFEDPSAWADNPGTRHVHQITNIEAFETEDPTCFATCSVFLNVRNRNLKDQDVLHGRRQDVLQLHPDGGFRLLFRTILVAQDILLSKNLNTFL